MMRLLVAGALSVALSFSACADAPVQLGQVPSFTEVDLDPWFERDSHLIVTAPNGLIAITGASRSSDDAAGAPDETIGILGVVLNDKSAGRAWAGYFEATHESGASWSAGLEIAVKNRGSNVISSAYYNPTSATVGIWLAGGGDAAYGGSPTYPTAAAIHIVKNAAPFYTAIVIDKEALYGANGTSGYATAMSLGKGHMISWGAPGNYAGANLYSNVATPGKNVNQAFVDDGVQWIDADSNVIAAFKKNTAPQFGTHQTTTGATICGYVEVRDVGGTLRKLAALC